MTLEWLRRHDPVLDSHLRTYLFTTEPVTEIEKEAEGDAVGSSSRSGGATDGCLEYRRTERRDAVNHLLQKPRPDHRGRLGPDRLRGAPPARRGARRDESSSTSPVPTAGSIRRSIWDGPCRSGRRQPPGVRGQLRKVLPSDRAAQRSSRCHAPNCSTRTEGPRTSISTT